MKKTYKFVFDKKKAWTFLWHSVLGIVLCFVTVGFGIPLVLFVLGGDFVEAITIEEN